MLRTSVIHRSDHLRTLLLFGGVWIAVVTAVAASSCSSRGKRTSYSVRDPALPFSFIIDHYVGPPLSEEEDDVFLVTDGDERELVFRGTGGKNVDFARPDKDVLLIMYCGGSVISIKSSALISHDPISILRIQSVTAPGLSANGKPVCKDGDSRASRIPELR